MLCDGFSLLYVIVWPARVLQRGSRDGVMAPRIALIFVFLSRAHNITLIAHDRSFFIAKSIPGTLPCVASARPEPTYF